MTKTKVPKKPGSNIKRYVTPEIKLEKNMCFMFDAIKKSSPKVACRQCSSCHGCR